MKLWIVMLLFIFPIRSIGQNITFKEYKNEKSHVSIKYPSTWHRKDNDKTVFIFMRPIELPGQQFQENINLVTKPSKGHSVKDFAEATQSQIQSGGLKNGKLIKVDYLTIKGKDYTRIIFEHESGGVPLKCIYYLLVQNDREYAICCSAMRNNFDEYFPVFEEMIKSFKTN